MTPNYRSRRRLVHRAVAMAVVAALGVAGAASAHAENLMDAYRQALQQDPVLKQAEAQQRVGQAGAGISRAVLLPHLDGGISYNDDHGTNTGPQLVQTVNGPQIVNTHSATGGRSRTDQVALNQVLFDLGDFAQLRASKATARADEAAYVSAQQDLILRVATAYFQVLTDEDQLKYARSNAASLKKSLDQAQAEYDVGLAAITDVQDAKASYDSAVAGVITAQNAVFTDRQALEQITGQATGNLEVLTENLPLNPPDPNNMDAWVQTALASNPALAAQRDQLDAAQHSVTAARAQRLPSLNASVSYSRTPSWGGSGSLNSFGGASALPASLRADSRSNDTVVGLTLSVPLFAGGGIRAQVQQAIALRDQANDVLVQDRRATISNTRNAFNAITAGISSVQAQKQAVISAKAALDATQAGYDVGTQSIVNLLIAQSTYFQALSAYSQARHAFVINQLNLKFAAGTLSVKALQAVNALLR